MNDERVTPEWLYQKLDAIFHFNLDAAATWENTKCMQYLTKEGDALRSTWNVSTMLGACAVGRVFVNPPYSRGQLPRWIEKATAEIPKHASLVVMLLPADTSTKAFKLAREHATALFFLGRRIDFGVGTGAKFPSLLAVFGDVTVEQLQALQELDGWLVIESKNLHVNR